MAFAYFEKLDNMGGMVNYRAGLSTEGNRRGQLCVPESGRSEGKDYRWRK